MGEGRAHLGETFDAASETYQRARPEYPDELITRVIEVTQVGREDSLLEIGCATGKATLAFARRGFRITCIEPGPNLVAAGRRYLGAYPDVTIVESRFDDWTAPEDRRFDLVFAANAWPGSIPRRGATTRGGPCVPAAT